MRNGIRFILSLILFFSINASSQDKSLLVQLQNGEKEAVEAIALYPEKERLAILEASKYPEVLVRMQNIKHQSEGSFQRLLADVSEEDQKKIFDLSRYPELIDAICVEDKKRSKAEMTNLLADYPKGVQENALYVNKKLFDTLQEVNRLYKSSEQTFEDLIAKYPVAAQNAYRELIQLPEVLMTLNDYMGTTVLLGDIYKNNPEQLKIELDSLNIIVAEEKSKELNEWKESLEDDPEAMAEYEKAAQEFAAEEGYSNPTNDSEINVEGYGTDIYIYNVWRPYPYWFGPPSWYYYDYWYPYPWWYHCGYYYGPDNGVYFVGMPSYYFMNWHWRHHHHLYYYPHFTNHVVNYYYGHRNSVSSVSSVTGVWIRQNKSNLPPNWLASDGRRIDRIREYGKFKMDFEAAQIETANNGLTQREYLEKNARSYPSLSPALRDKRNTVYGPPKKEAKDVAPKSREYPSRENRKGENRVIENPSNPQKVDRARTYHIERWKKTDQKPKVQPKPIQQSPKKKTPTQQVPSQNKKRTPKKSIKK